MGGLLVQQGNSFLRWVLFAFFSLVAPCAVAQESTVFDRAELYNYVQWDVFTDMPLTGNQLAVFRNRKV